MPGCLLVFFLLTGSFWWDALVRPILYSGPAKASQTDCMKNVQRMAIGMLTYAQDWDNTLPPAGRWQWVEQSLPANLEKPVFACRSGKTANSYGLNTRAGGADIVSIKEPEVTVMFFETDSAGPNAVGDQHNLPEEARHAGSDVYALLDGHVNRLPRTSMSISW